MEDLRLGLIQSDIYWHQTEANLADFEEKIWALDGNPDLIILPEMFNTGFTMETRSNAEMINGRTFKWMRNMASQTKAVITGSMITSENSAFFNRLFWMRPDGSFSFYDKKHLFRMSEENQKYRPGRDLLIENIRGWNICPLICYDLRFPVWSRNTYNKNEERLKYDLLIYVANWPEARINAWEVLLKARAIENSCFTVGVNRTGPDGNGVAYNGHSAVTGPKGEDYIEITSDPRAETVVLSMDYLLNYRKKFPVHMDSDPFELT